MGLRQRLCACCANVQHASAHDATVSLLPHWLVWCAQSISRGKAGRAHKLLHCITDTSKHFSGEVSRPDLAACIASGLFDLCLEATKAVVAAGVDGLQDTHHGALYMAMSLVRTCRAQPGCEAKIRGAADALAFCLMNDLDYLVELGNTTAAAAASICENPATRCSVSR